MSDRQSDMDARVERARQQLRIRGLSDLQVERIAVWLHLPELLAERDRLAEALAFYAEQRNYDVEGVPGEWITTPGHPGSYDGFEETDFEPDFGERARAALQTGNTEESDTHGE